MDISIINLMVGLMLMAVPFYVFYRFRMKLVASTAVALARMLVQMTLIGVYLKYLFEWNNAWVNILWVVVMVAVASFTALRRTRLRWQTALLPVAAGFFCSSMVVGLYFLFVVLRLPNPFDSRYFIPVMGILMGNMLSVAVIAISSYYDSLHRELPQYYYLLGNGASHIEAVTPFIRSALEKSFAPCIANMAVMGIVSLPGTMTGQILGGSAPGIAIKYQIMIIIITFSASMISLAITLYLSDRRTFDSYGRLKNIWRMVDKGQSH